MNNTVYIFGKWAEHYTSYPLDYTQTFFESMAKQLNNSELLAIHREGAVMYYAYFYRLNATDYIGVADVVTDICYTDLNAVLSKFQQVVTLLATQGEVLKLTIDGKVVALVNNLSDCPNEVASAMELLQQLLSSVPCQKLPPVDYSVSSQEIKTCSITDNQAVTNTCRFAYTMLLPKADMENLALKGYQETLQKANKQTILAQAETVEWKYKYAKLEKQQKQTKKVVWLLIILIVGGIVAITYWYNANAEIKGLRGKLSETENCLERTTTQYNDLHEEHRKLIFAHGDSVRALNSIRRDYTQAKENIATLQRDTTQKGKDYRMQKRLAAEYKDKFEKKDKDYQALQQQYQTLSKSKNSSSQTSASTSPKLYTVIEKNTPVYFYEEAKMKKSKDKMYKGNNVVVYTTRWYNYEEYGLTISGYIKMSALSMR